MFKKNFEKINDILVNLYKSILKISLHKQVTYFIENYFFRFRNAQKETLTAHHKSQMTEDNDSTSTTERTYTCPLPAYISFLLEENMHMHYVCGIAVLITAWQPCSGLFVNSLKKAVKPVHNSATGDQASADEQQINNSTTIIPGQMVCSLNLNESSPKLLFYICNMHLMDFKQI